MTSHYHEKARQLWRIRLLAAMTVIMIGFLTVMLFRMQVRQSDRYEESLSDQSMRRVRLPASRGRIFDRAGHLLADNRPSFDLVAYLEELRQPGPWDNTVRVVMKALDDLTVLMAAPPLVGEQQLRAHIRRRLPLPLTLWRGLTPGQVARFAERRREFTGIDIQPTPLRTYPAGRAAGHIVGYVGRADPETPASEEPVSFYLPEFEGKAGIEAHYNRELRGRAGGLLIRVDAAGYRWEDVTERAAEPGSDIQLALDLRIQQWVEQALTNVSGAAVVLDPRNGDVLAIASQPAYDPNIFVPLIRASDWTALRSDQNAPLLNRALAGRYPPASTIKPLVAIGALVNRVIDPDTSIVCTGAYRIGTLEMRCWQRRGHGPLKLRRALEQSCNPYFIDLALRGGYEIMLHQMTAVGLGQRSGIDLPFESAGLLPDDYWKRRTQGEGWRHGDTANVAIGQGALLVTPLQMAVMTAALANGGRIWQPRLAMGVRHPDTATLQSLPPRLRHVIDWPAADLQAVQTGMRDVIHGLQGTGRNAWIEGVTMAGKTGTAEIGPKHLDRRHGWMIAYAPFERPRYAVAMVVENAESGGMTVAPRIAALMESLMGGEAR